MKLMSAEFLYPTGGAIEVEYNNKEGQFAIFQAFLDEVTGELRSDLSYPHSISSGLKLSSTLDLELTLDQYMGFDRDSESSVFGRIL